MTASTVDTAPAVATRRMTWFKVHHLVLERSMPVPGAVSLHERLRVVTLSLAEQGQTDRWAATLGIINSREVGSHTWYEGQVDGWTWHIRCIPAVG